MNIGKFEKRMNDALGEVKHLLVQSGYYDNQTLENIDCDRNNPDDVQRWNELTNTSKLLLKAVDDLNYLHRTIAGTSRLHLDTSGRYEEDFNEYTSGSGIEFLLADDCSKPCWVRSRVEVDDDGNYYIVAHKGLNMDGLETRARKCGMFEDENVVRVLNDAKVKIHKGYLENVEEVYQMADAYLFPTRSAEFVISIPLSVMEALSSGVPVIGYKSFENLNEITGSEGAITLIDNAEQLDEVLPEVIKKKSDHSLLEKTGSWGDVAQSVLRMVREENA